MKKAVLIKRTRHFLAVSCIAALSLAHGQEIIYQQNFDGNNGNFNNTIVSQNTAINGWLSSSTAPQYADVYRHMWNFSDVTTGGNPYVLPISGRSLGMGFYNGNEPNVPNQHFRTWDGDLPDQTFFTTRWAHVGFSTQGYENITIEFKWRCTGELFEGVVYDYGTVNTSIDGGSTWAMDQSAGLGGTTSEHGTFGKGLYYGNADVQTAILTLPESRADQPNFRLAFRMVVDEGYGTGGGFIVDDIIVRGTAINLNTVESNKANVNVYKDGEEFVVKSSTLNIHTVEVYDLSGKKVKTLNNMNKEVRIRTNQLPQGVYVLKAMLENGEELTKKIIK